MLKNQAFARAVSGWILEGASEHAQSLKTDQRGKSRHDKEDTGGCDMGAYEGQTDWCARQSQCSLRALLEQCLALGDERGPDPLRFKAKRPPDV